MRLALITLVFGLVAPAGAEVLRSPQGLLSVDVQGATLEAALQQVSRVVSLQMLLVDPAVRSRPVSVSFRDKETAAALQAILDAAKVNYVLMGTKLYAGDPSAAVPFMPADGGSTADSRFDKPGEAERARAEEAENEALKAKHEAEQQQNFDLLMQKMAPVEHPPGPRTVTLPFPNPDGSLRTVEVGGGDGTVPLPFPGPDGKLGRRVPVDPALKNQPPPGFDGKPAPTVPAAKPPSPPPAQDPDKKQ